MTFPDITDQLELRHGQVSLRLMKLRDSAGLAAAAEENGNREGAVPLGLAAAVAAATNAYHDLRTSARCTFVIYWHDRIVGSISYAGVLERPASDVLAVDIGHGWLARSAQLVEVATAVEYLLLAFAFDTWKVQRARIRCIAQVGHAEQAIATYGLHCDGLLRHDIVDANGTLRDVVIHSVLAEEWPAVRSELESRLEPAHLVPG